MGTEVATDDGFGGAGFRVVLFGGYVFGVPESGDCGDVSEDVLGSWRDVR